MSEPPVGYANPPIASRFPPGTSGNPRGGKRGPRPRKRRPHPFDTLIPVKTPKGKVQMTMGERLMLEAVSMVSVTPDDKLYAALEKQKARMDKAFLGLKPRVEKHWFRSIRWSRGSDLQNSNDVIQHLDIGRVLWPETMKPRMALEPFIVQAAIDRMAPNQLTLDEQNLVLSTTRCAWQLKLPDWWDPAAKANKRALAKPRETKRDNQRSDEADDRDAAPLVKYDL